MARIRTVKPEFWTDEVIVELDYSDRLLFIGLWNFADDQGYLPLRPKRIKMQVFPGDDYDVAAGLERLWKASLVSLYAHFDDLLVHVTNWKRHQKISNPATEKYLRADLHLLDSWPADLASPLETYPAEGKGREGKGSLSSSTDVEGEVDADAPNDRFEEFWSTYGKKVGKKAARAKWRIALKKRDVDADMLIRTAGTYVADLKAEGKFPSYAKDPERWLSGECWQDERSNVRHLRPEGERPEGVPPDAIALPPLPKRGFFDQ